MKILITTQYFYPERFLINEIVESLVDKGHQVTVLTGLPNYPSGIIDKEYLKGKKSEDYYKGAKVIRVNEIPRKRPIMKNLIINYLSFAYLASSKVFQIDKPDVIFSYQVTPVSQIIPAIVGKFLFKKKLLIYCLDLFPYSFEHWTGNKSLIYKIVKLISKSIYKHGDRILVSSKPFIDYMMEVNSIESSKLSYLPQHANEDLLEISEINLINEEINFMYAGNVGVSQNLQILIDAVAKISSTKKFKIHIVGEGNFKSEFVKQVKDKNLANKFIFHDAVPMEQMKEFYKIAHVLLLTLRPKQITIPGKLQAYMATGRPILGAIDGGAKEIIETSDCGIAIPPNDATNLAEEMIKIINNPLPFFQKGKNGRDYFIENFTKDVYVNELIKELNLLVNKTS